MADDRQNPQSQRPGQGGPGRPPGLKPGGPPGGLFVWVVFLFALLLGVYWVVQHGKQAKREQIHLSDFYKALKEGKIADAGIRRNVVEGHYRGPFAADQVQEYSVPIHDLEIENLSKTMAEYNTDPKYPGVRFSEDPGSEFMQVFLVQILPVVILVVILWWLLARQFRSAGGAGSVLSFGKARAKLHTKEQSNVTFDQVAGIDEAKEEVQELVEFLKSPMKFRRLGGRIPRGVILIGPPGCGKTLLAKAIAGEAEVPFFSISGSDFVEMFVGVGASRVRDLFHQAKESAPCIIFLDEIDAVGRRRAVDIHGSNAESAQTLNAILVEMDGFETDDNVIVIAATNRPDVLDPALLRPGRFDRQIIVDLPDIRGREAILKVHARKYKLAADVDLRQIARGTPMFSGADLEALMNEAALLATRTAKLAVTMGDLEEARDKVLWGRQRRSRQMTEEDRRITAYHESGHAIVAKLLPDAEPLHKVSIIPQGRALGMTMSLPDRDRYHIQRRRMLADIAIALAGRAAEEAFCDDITSGAQSDLDRATDIARSMVCRWGMSEVLGPVSYHEMEEPASWWQEPTRGRSCSEATSVKIDEEITRLTRDGYETAKRLISEHRTELDNLAKTLLKYEVLYNAEVEAIMAGKEVTRPPVNGSAEGEAAAAEPKHGSDRVEMLPGPQPMQEQKPKEKTSA
jgi:cell division protease FtsH